MAKIHPLKGMQLCPMSNCTYGSTSQGALSRHIRFGHSIEINEMRDQLVKAGYFRKILNKMNESQLAKEIQKLKRPRNSKIAPY